MGVSLPVPLAHRPPVRGVLLDVFDTLFSPAKLSSAFAACGLDGACAPLWLSLLFSSGIAFTAAEDYRRFTDIAANTLKALDPTHVGRAEVQTVLRAMQQLEPHPDTAAGLARLRAAGVRVLTLTQQDAASCAALFGSAGLRDLVDGFLSAEAVRRWKPAPATYTYGAAQVGWPPANVALISAHDWDIHGARRAGLQTGRLLRCAVAPTPLFDRADVTAPDLPTVVEELLSG